MIYNNYVQSSHSPIQWPHSLRLVPVSNWTITHHPALGIKCWPCQGIPPYRRDSRFQFGIETKTANLLFVSENMWAPVGFGTKGKIPKPNIKHHNKQTNITNWSGWLSLCPLVQSDSWVVQRPGRRHDRLLNAPKACQGHNFLVASGYHAWSFHVLPACPFRLTLCRFALRCLPGLGGIPCAGAERRTLSPVVQCSQNHWVSGAYFWLISTLKGTPGTTDSGQSAPSSVLYYSILIPSHMDSSRSAPVDVTGSSLSTTDPINCCRFWCRCWGLKEMVSKR